LTIRPLTEHGVWTDLSIGREILASKTIQHEDIFSFASSGQKWVDENWLYQVILYWLYSMIGISGLIIINGLLITWAAFLFVRLSYTRRWNPAITAVILAATFYLFREKWLLRAQTIGIIIYLIELYILRQYQATRKKRYLWCIPLLILLWVNIHVSFFIGLITLIIFCAAEILKKYMRQQYSRWFGRTFRWKQIIGLVFVTILSVIASLFNPYGKEIYFHSIQSPSVTMLYCIMDWISFERVFMLNIPLLVIPAFAFLSMFFVPARKSDLTDGILLVLLFPICYYLKRFTIFPFLLTLALSLKYIGVMINIILYELRFSKKAIRLASTAVYGTLCIACVIFFTVKYIHAAGFENFLNYDARSDFYPRNAVEYIKANDVKPNIYTPFFYSGFLLYQTYPEYKNFVDYRTMYIAGGMPLLDDLKIRRAEIGWEWIIDKYNINTMLLRYTPGKQYIMKTRDQFHEKVAHSPDWRLAYFDDNDMVYIRSHYEIHNYDKDRLFLYYDPEDIWKLATASKLHLQMMKDDLLRRITMDPPSAWAYLALGIISIKDGDHDKAGEYIAKAVSIQPDNKDLALYQSLWTAHQNKTPLPKRTGNYEDNLQTAFTLMVMGFFEEAEMFLQDIVTDHPNTYKAYIYLAICRQELDMYDKALYACQKALTMKPTDTMVAYYLAKCYMKFKIYDQASKKIREAIQFDQNNYLYWFTLAEAYYHRGNYDDAMRMCRKAVKIRPHFVEAWFLAGDLYRRLKMYDNSIDVLNKAMILEPLSERIYLSMAITYLAKQDYEEAIDNLARVTNPIFEPDPHYLFAKAQIAAWQGNNDTALDFLARAIYTGGGEYKKMAADTPEFNALLSESRFIELIK
jgi:tetratricopeptide (TPR) repeat protein